MATNILLVVLDAVRRDALECYGAPPGSTPAIADLARRGTALPRAYATSSWTLPSHASMFSGLLPRRLGLTQAPGGNPQSARPALEGVNARLLPRVLHGAGFATRGWSTNLWVSPYAGFDIGFDSFTYVPSGRVERMNALLAGGRRAQLGWALEGLRSRSDDGAGEVGSSLRQAIGDWSGEPTFWFVNLCECHSPYLPPKPWNDLAASDRVRAALDAQQHMSFESICLYVAGSHEIPDQAMARMRHLYARAAGYMDDWISGVLDALERRGILDETLVIITSDHGENFGEDNLIAHGFSVDERLIHVPLLMAGPGARSYEEVFSLAKLPLAIAEAANLRDHPWAEDDLPRGVAVAQYDPLGSAEHPLVQDAARKWGLAEEGVERLTARFTSATDGSEKLVVRNDRELIYDLGADPAEEHAIDPSQANGTIATLREALEHPAVTVVSGATAGSVEPAVVGTDEIAAIEKQMKLLGYM